jgi:hypothetical protein
MDEDEIYQMEKQRTDSMESMDLQQSGRKKSRRASGINSLMSWFLRKRDKDYAELSNGNDSSNSDDEPESRLSAPEIDYQHFNAPKKP